VDLWTDSRKPERGADQFLARLEARAAPFALSAILDEIVPVPRPIQKGVAVALGFEKAQKLYTSLKTLAPAQSIQEGLLKELAITYRVGQRDIQQVPRSGAVLVVANHPFGILEGAVLAAVLGPVRPDVRFLANDFLSTIPEIEDLLIPVDPMGGSSAARRNLRGLRRSIDFLERGGCLVVFPAGEVSHFHLREAAVTDSEWHTTVARMIETLSNRGVAVSTLPAYIGGANSLVFQTFGLLHPRLRTLLLVRELLNKRNRLVELRIGSLISSKKLLEIPTPEERTEYLRWRTYVLANRPDYKAKTSVPLPSRLRRAPQALRAPSEQAPLCREIATLGAEQILVKTGDLDVYLAPARFIPYVLGEIGRLRELTFRAAGEGTGKSTDLDRFDSDYLHLFAWHAGKGEIVGAYRLVGTDKTQDLYTATLFKYGEAFLQKMGPALELGRSFVRPEYQRGLAPLLALWNGIGAYIARNPRYRVLFGPVSISNRYQAVSRELMVSFLERYASLREWTGLVSNRNTFRKRCSAAVLPPVGPGFGLDAEDLSDVVSDLESSRTGIPVLLRQYLKLGGKLLGFNVDPEFSDTLDGLIVVDLLKTERRLLERYLGKEEAAVFFGYQKGTHGT
jgi:putative hemolysin